MEVVALNEQLREEFAGVVKHFLPIRREEIALTVLAHVDAVNQAQVQASAAKAAAADSVVTDSAGAELDRPVSASTPEMNLTPEPNSGSKAEVASVPGAVLLERTRQFGTLAKAILGRVNSYQYKSREQFGRDIADLLAFADSSDQKLLLQQLLDQQCALTQSSKHPGRMKRQKVNGIRVDSMGIPGIQCRTFNTWACNLGLGGYTATMAVYPSQSKAQDAYSNKFRGAFRDLSTRDLFDMTQDLATTCSKFDDDVLRDAMKQVKQRLPTAKHLDVASIAPVATPAPPAQPVVAAPSPVVVQDGTVALGDKKETKSSRKRVLVVDTSTAPTVTTATLSNGKAITPAAATPELVAARTPTNQHSRKNSLRLRRLIQMRLCRHLEGREICPRLNEPGVDEVLEPTGRLDRGKVYVYKTKRLAKFSDYVTTVFESSRAPCAHLFLVETRESIDSHLLVCDQFSEEFRQQLDENFQEISELYKQGKIKTN